MRAIKKISDYKNKLLLSTALTAAILFSDVPPVAAAACSDSTNGADCTVTGTVSVSSITAKNINSSSNQTGTLNITGTGSSSLTGNVYLSGLDLENNGTVIFSGTNSVVNTITLNNGTLVINNGKLYVSSESSETAKIYGTGTLQLDDGWIDSTDGNKLAGLTVGSGTVNLSYNRNDVNLGAVTYASADKGILLVKGGGGEVSIDSYTAQSANNKLQVASGGTLNVENITAYDINAAGSQYGTVNVSGSGVFNGPVYLSSLNVLTGGSITFGSGFEMHGALNIKNAANIGIRNKTYISDLGGVFSNGITDNRTYTLYGGTWTGKGGQVNGVPNEYSTGEITRNFENGIFQNGANGILISQSDPLNPPTIDFQGGVIWDYSAYVPSLPDGTVVLDNGETVGKNTVSGDINISGGILTGKIDIRKGNPLSTFSTQDAKGEVKTYNVLSSGNINISGGQLHFTEDNSQIIMYKNNMGNINISGGAMGRGRKCSGFGIGKTGVYR